MSEGIGDHRREYYYDDDECGWCGDMDDTDDCFDDGTSANHIYFAYKLEQV